MVAFRIEETPIGSCLRRGVACHGALKKLLSRTRGDLFGDVQVSLIFVCISHLNKRSRMMPFKCAYLSSGLA